jgi:glycosyltransferase involved in cell wall biosynthesis
VTRLLLDLRIINQMEAAGLARYAGSLAPLLLARQGHDYRFVGVEPTGPFQAFSDQHAGFDVPEADGDAAKRMLALICWLEKADLLFSPYYPVPERRTCRAALMIHDLLPLRYPEWFPTRTHSFFDDALRRSARSADRILVNSECTRAEVQDAYGIAKGRIAVVPLAAASAFARGADDTPADEHVLTSLGIRRPYLLAVSTIEPRKNIQGVLGAYALLRRRFDVGLVMVGKYGWKAGAVVDGLTRGPHRDDIVVTGHVTDRQLASLYRCAEVFLYPSFYEGFGLPVLEAMTAGAPVVTSRGGALPEVSGDAVAYCEADSPESIAEAAGRIVSDTAYRRGLVAKGRARAARFSWQHTADRTHEELLACLEC